MNDPFLGLQDVPAFHVTSRDIVDGGKLMDKKFMSGDFGIEDGQDISPELHWTGAPSNTKAYEMPPYTTLMHQLDQDFGIGQS